MLITTAKKTRLSLPNKNSLGIYTGYGGVAGFSRATTKTCFGYLENALPGDSQYILTIPSGIPCFPGLRFIASDNTWSDIYSDGNPIDDANLGVLIEPTSTNYATYSNDFRNTTDAGETRPWGYTRLSAVQNNSLIINNVSFNKIIEDSTVGNSHSIGRIVSGLPYGAITITCKLKSGTRGYAILASIANANGTSKTYNVVVDLSTGTAIGAGTLATANAPINAHYQAKVLDDGVIEASVTQDFVSGAGTQFNANLYIANTSTTALLANPGYNGDGVSYIYATDMQVEVSAFKTSHIPTTTSSATRNADIQTIQTAQNINRYQGSLSFDFTPTHNAVGTVALGGSYVDANNGTVILQTAGTGYIFRKRISGVNYDAPLSGDFVADTTYQAEIKWSTQNGTDIFINGTKGTNNPDTKPLQLGSTWQIGADGNSSQQAGACFKNVLTKYK